MEGCRNGRCGRQRVRDSEQRPVWQAQRRRCHRAVDAAIWLTDDYDSSRRPRIGVEHRGGCRGAPKRVAPNACRKSESTTWGSEEGEPRAIRSTTRCLTRRWGSMIAIKGLGAPELGVRKYYKGDDKSARQQARGRKPKFRHLTSQCTTCSSACWFNFQDPRSVSTVKRFKQTHSYTNSSASRLQYHFS